MDDLMDPQPNLAVYMQVHHHQYRCADNEQHVPAGHDSAGEAKPVECSSRGV